MVYVRIADASGTHWGSSLQLTTWSSFDNHLFSYLTLNQYQVVLTTVPGSSYSRSGGKVLFTYENFPPSDWPRIASAGWGTGNTKYVL